VKTYFLPDRLAKKGKQSSPFFGEKATQTRHRAGFTLGFPQKKAGFACPFLLTEPAKSGFLLLDD
jgi:hypothetical protein